MTTPSADHCRWRPRRGAPEGSPGTPIVDPLQGLVGSGLPRRSTSVSPRRPTVAPVVGGILRSTRLLLDAAGRMELLAADARAAADRAADAERDYLSMADRLRLLASSAPDGIRTHDGQDAAAGGFAGARL